MSKETFEKARALARGRMGITPEEELARIKQAKVSLQEDITHLKEVLIPQAQKIGVDLATEALEKALGHFELALAAMAEIGPEPPPGPALIESPTLPWMERIQTEELPPEAHE